MMHCHELLFPSCHPGIKGQSSLTLIKEVGSFQMRVTIQVCIKQLNPCIPLVLPMALLLWPTNLTSSVTHTEEKAG